MLLYSKLSTTNRELRHYVEEYINTYSDFPHSILSQCTALQSYMTMPNVLELSCMMTCLQTATVLSKCLQTQIAESISTCLGLISSVSMQMSQCLDWVADVLSSMLTVPDVAFWKFAWRLMAYIRSTCRDALLGFPRTQTPSTSTRGTGYYSLELMTPRNPRSLLLGGFEGIESFLTLDLSYPPCWPLYSLQFVEAPWRCSLSLFC